DEAEIEEAIGLADSRPGKATLVARPEARSRYVAAALGRLGGPLGLAGLRLVVDCANGATTSTARPVLEHLGATVETPVGSDPNGAINDGCGTQHPQAWLAAVR